MLRFAVYTYLHNICRSTGFILEGFPSKPEELRLLADKGFYPDAAIVLQVKI